MTPAQRGALTLGLLLLGAGFIMPALFTLNPDGLTLLGAVAWGFAYAASPRDKKEQS